MSCENSGKVVFALGSEVSAEHYFKSSFARSFVSNNCRGGEDATAAAKSLDLEFLDNGKIRTEEESEDNIIISSANKEQNNFFSLVNFDGGDNTQPQPPVLPPPLIPASGPPSTLLWQTFEVAPPSNVDMAELDKLRKQCQSLTEENQRLADALQTNQVPRVQVIDNVLLNNQIDTLQWQLKQTEANRQMYRSLMGEVVRFLERARKSLDIIHEKSNPKGKTGASRAQRCRSVYGIDESDSLLAKDLQQKSSNNEKNNNNNHKNNNNNSTYGSNRWSMASSGASGTTTPAGSSTPSKFARAKSVAQISSQTSPSPFRDFTWSVLRKNEPSARTSKSTCSSPVASEPPGTPRSQPEVVYRRPAKQSVEIDPDNVPPERLSQEAFRLMRTVQSLLSMREPNLAMVSHDEELSIMENEFANSTLIHEETGPLLVNRSSLVGARCSSSDPASGESDESEKLNLPKKKQMNKQQRDISICSNSGALRSLVQTPPVRRNVTRRSIDAASVNSSSSKTTEEDEEEPEFVEDSKSSKSSKPKPKSKKNLREFLPIGREFFGPTRKTASENEEEKSALPKLKPKAKKTLRETQPSPANRERFESPPPPLPPTATPRNEEEIGETSVRRTGASVWSSRIGRGKPAQNSVSSAEDESGFSSMSSFQEVGLPFAPSPIRGCHTEIGLPEVPLEKIRHRRWSSTPAEMAAMFKRHSNAALLSGKESLSVWV